LSPASPSTIFIQSFSVTEYDPPTPQLTANVTPNEAGYDVSWVGTGFSFAETVGLFLAGLTGRTAPLSIGESTVDASGNISGDYTYICTSSEVPPSPSVTLQAQVGGTIFALSSSFAFTCT
jgi:hypothetical protein